MKVFIERVRRLKPHQHRPFVCGTDVQNSGRAAQTSCDLQGQSADFTRSDFEDANHATSPATAGDGDFNHGPDL
jgi:hypothetical protein